MIKGKVRGRIALPIFSDFKEELERIGERVIIPSMQKNIDEGRDIDGNEYDPLDSKTIKSKGGDRRPLIGKERELRRAFRVKATKKNVKVILNNKRKEVGKYLQILGIKSKKYGRRYFNFFGITEEAEKLGVREISNRIKKEIKNAKPRTFK